VNSKGGETMLSHLYNTHLYNTKERKMLSLNLKASVEIYSTKEPEELIGFLNGLSKPSLIALCIDLLTLYFNDKNSSKLRELTTLWVFGYNGYRMDVDTGRRVDCEVKPQNTDDPKKKLNGGGSFNDYTLERFSKDLENNPIILVSGFVGGKLIYIFEFKFECLKEKLKGLLERRFPKGQRREGEYLRSAGFSFRDYKDCPALKLAYLRLPLKGPDKIL
jgi:hypothetical protein